MFYYLYEIRNNLNGKIYIGVHKTKNMNDGYMGSGIVIKTAIEKYGKENFTKTILEYFDDSKTMYDRETEIVNEEFLLRESVYNLRRGGLGGFDNKTIDFSSRNSKCGKKRTEKMNNNPEFRAEMIAQAKRAYNFENMRNGMLRKLADTGETYNHWQKGSKRTDESKAKMSEASVGERNSQFNTMWITDGERNQKIQKTDTIPEGWHKGRKIIKQ